jgi:hypothetical protein
MNVAKYNYQDFVKDMEIIFSDPCLHDMIPTQEDDFRGDGNLWIIFMCTTCQKLTWVSEDCLRWFYEKTHK